MDTKVCDEAALMSSKPGKHARPRPDAIVAGSPPSGRGDLSRRDLLKLGASAAIVATTGIANSEAPTQVSERRLKMETVLVTGAGTGIGNEVALRLAGRGYQVTAGVEIAAQIEAVKRQAIRRGVSLKVVRCHQRSRPPQSAKLGCRYLAQ